MLPDNLPCIHIQDSSIAEAASAKKKPHREDLTTFLQLEDHTWHIDGTLTGVTILDHGNGWSTITDLQPATPKALKQFVENLWDEILNKAPNTLQNRVLLSDHIQRDCGNLQCECAKRMAALTLA